MRPGKRFLGVAALALATGGDATAQELGARSLGRAGAGRADPDDVAAVSANIAAIATGERYDMFGHAALGPDTYLGVAAGAVDTRTSVIGFGGGYSRVSDEEPPIGAELPGWKDADTDLDDLTLRQGVHAALSVPVVKRQLTLAVMGRYDWATSEVSGESNGFNLGVGVAGRPWEWLVIAAGARDLFDTEYAHARTGDLAVRWMPTDGFAIEVDAIAPLDDTFAAGAMSFEGGLDGKVAKWLVLRGGGAWDAGDAAVAAGLGLLHEKAALDYGVRIPLATPEKSWHALDVRVLF
jgi:hypothetical protein